MSVGPKQLSNAYVSVLKLNSTGPIEALAVVQLDSTGGIVSGAPGGGSTQVSIKEILTSSGASVMDSTESAIKVNVVAGAAGGSTYVSVRQSTNTDLVARVFQGPGISSGGDAWPTLTVDSSNAVVKPGDSANNAVRVNVVAGSAGSTTATVRQSTAADLNAAVVQGSTVWQAQVSTVAGRVLVDQNSTVWPVQIPSSQSIQVKNSTIGDLLASVQQNSTVWQTQAALRTSSGGGVEGSTTTQSTGAVLGLNVREVQPSGRQSTTVVITSSNSTATYTLASSVAGLKQKAYAYAVTSTVTTPSTFVFCSVGSSDNTTADRWAFALGSGSSGITGANLAIGPPGFLFESITADAIKCRIENGGSTQTLARVSISWFTEA